MKSLLNPNNISEAFDLYNALLETNPSGIFVYDSEGNLVDCNQVACDMHELTKKEILGMRPDQFIHPDGYETFMTFQKELKKNGSFFGESCGITKSGKKFFVEVYGKLVTVDEKNYLYSTVKDITKQKDYIQSLISQEKNLESLVMERTFQLEEAMRNLKATQKRLVGSERLATLGSLLSGIAHELKNPLNLTTNASRFIKDFLNDLSANKSLSLPDHLKEEIESAKEMARISLDSGLRADQVIQGMLSQVRSERPTLQKVNVPNLLREALGMALSANSTKNSLKVKENFPKKVEAYVYPQELTRALINLVDNSIYSLKQKFGEGLEGAELDIDFSSNDNIALEIRDNGEGIPDDVFEKICDQFFTTKPPGKGTGIGLALTKEIIEDLHQGSIYFTSQYGQYTCVKILLPLKLDK